MIYFLWFVLAIATGSWWALALLAGWLVIVAIAQDSEDW